MFGFMNKDENKTFSAYTLAEMLIVLLIISVVLLSLPQATKKLFKVKEVKVYHGRYECYWEVQNAGAGGAPVKRLKYYSAQDRAGGAPLIKEGYVNGDKCEFIPPVTYPYIMIHAVGGGGAGGVLQNGSVGNPYLNVAYIDYDKGVETNWSKWFVKFISKVRSNSGLKSTYHIEDASSDEKNTYPTNVIVKQIDLKYRKAGAAGEVASMFFPSLPIDARKFYLYPGKGGDLKAYNQNGGNGQNTVVQVVKSGSVCNKDDSNAACNIIYARGGSGATVLDSSNIPINLSSAVQLRGGKLSDYGVSAYPDVKAKTSGFRDVIDKINKQTELATRVPEDAGDGGNGASNFPKLSATLKNSHSGFMIHEFDNFSGPDAGIVGTNWVPISQHIDANMYNDGSASCTNVNSNPQASYGGDVWVTRSTMNISAICYPDSVTSVPSRFYCAVGNMNRSNLQLPCKSIAGGRCARYVYRRSGASYVLESTDKNFPEALTSVYKVHPDSFVPNLVAPYYNSQFYVTESIPTNSNHIRCSVSGGYEYTGKNGLTTPCSSGSTDYDLGKGLCRPKQGGDGAVVILW